MLRLVASHDSPEPANTKFVGIMDHVTESFMTPLLENWRTPPSLIPVKGATTRRVSAFMADGTEGHVGDGNGGEANPPIAPYDEGVRPEAVGLLIGIECSRVGDSSWMYLTSFCNYPNRCRTSCSTRKLPDHIVVGLQLYSARTFHVILSPRIYKGG